jgi:hypothetical protein
MLFEDEGAAKPGDRFFEVSVGEMRQDDVGGNGAVFHHGFAQLLPDCVLLRRCFLWAR